MAVRFSARQRRLRSVAPPLTADWSAATEEQLRQREAYLLALVHPTLDEGTLQQIGDALALCRGFLVYGIPDSRMATAAGFPDRVYVRPPLCLFVEYKTERGRLHGRQQEWHDALAACPGITFGVIRPSTIDHLVELLRKYG